MMPIPTLVELLKEASADRPAAKIHVFKTKELPAPEKQTINLIVDFIRFAVAHLKLSDKEIKIRLVHAAPKEPMTTGAYDPNTKKISVIFQNRHFIDYCRTIAHELVHMKQDFNGRVEMANQEIGGPIEDEANAIGGRIIKLYIKEHLTPEQKKYLGLGVY